MTTEGAHLAPSASRREAYDTCSSVARNSAARLEEMTKEVGRSIVLADATREALADPPAGLDFIGDVEVRGRQSNIGIWALDSAASSIG